MGGFAQIADDAPQQPGHLRPLPISPTLSISVAASGSFRRSWPLGTVTATLVVDNQVEVDTGTTYNVTGVLKGKSQTVKSWWAAITTSISGASGRQLRRGLVLSMAKALVDSGYQPENDIVFCLHGAEEGLVLHPV